MNGVSLFPHNNNIMFWTYTPRTMNEWLLLKYKNGNFTIIIIIKISRAGVAEWSTAPCLWHGWSWVQAPNLHQCLQTHLQVCGLKRLGCHADLYTVSRCHTRGEKKSMQARDPPWLWNPGKTLPEVQNRGISGLTKRTCVLQKFKKKKKKKIQCTIINNGERFSTHITPWKSPTKHWLIIFLISKLSLKMTIQQQLPSFWHHVLIVKDTLTNIVFNNILFISGHPGLDMSTYEPQ